MIKKVIKSLPYLKRVFVQRDGLIVERDHLQAERDKLKVERDAYRDQMQCQYKYPGHFHSPIPSIEEIRANEEKLFGPPPRALPEIDMNEQGQFSLFEKLKTFYADLPFETQKKEGLRYYFTNRAFGEGDAILLFCMLRHIRPKKVIEVGSGHSSCVLLDTNQYFFDNAISCTFIEPYPDLLFRLISKEDRNRITVIDKNLQDVELKRFKDLSAGDILFIDSSHVSKINSDVNYIFFEILPALETGVYIHFHDIFYPFEYPKGWIYEGRAWNEAYLLRAFLEYNDSYQILFFNSYWSKFRREEIGNAMSLWLKNPGGSIWLKKVK